MSNLLLKRLIVVLLIIVVLILGVQVINKFIDKNIDTSTSSLVFNNIKLNDVEALEYILPDKNFKFTKSNNKWFINDYLASQRGVEVAISKLLALEVSYIASEDSTNYSIFEVNNDKSRIILTALGKQYIILVGKTTFEGGSFIRYKDSSSTLATNNTISSILDYDLSFFRDKSVTMIDQAEIKSFKINSNEYTNNNGEWRKNNELISYDSVKNLLVLISNIEGISFADNTDYDGINNEVPLLNIILKTQTKEYGIRFIRYKENLYIIDNNNPEYLIGLQSLADNIIDSDLNI